MIINALIKEQLLKLWEILASIIRTALVILILCFVLWLAGGRPDIRSSLQNVIKNFVIIRLEPRSELYTQFAHEYDLGKYGESASIPNGKVLVINTMDKTIWVGVHNYEPVSLRNVLFTIFFPEGVIAIDEHIWKDSWRSMDIAKEKGFFTQLTNSIQPERGGHFEPPLRVKFPKAGDYLIRYKYYCDDFAPKSGWFIIRVRNTRSWQMKKLIGIKELSEHLNIAVTTIYSWTSMKVIPFLQDRSSCEIR